MTLLLVALAVVLVIVFWPSKSHVYDDASIRRVKDTMRYWRCDVRTAVDKAFPDLPSEGRAYLTKYMERRLK